MKKIKICSISDTHGHIPDLPEADILVIAGDLTAMDTKEQNWEFIEWLMTLDYKDIILVPGNHDVYLENHEDELRELIASQNAPIHLLIDEAVTIQGIKFWGCPWMVRFVGLNPACAAFTVDSEAQMNEKVFNVPNDVDIFVSHSPSYGHLDQTRWCEKVGSMAMKRVIARVNPRFCCFGHIHEQGGRQEDRDGIIYANVSYVDEQYKPHDKPIQVIEVESKKT